jgi:hypothetical protein
MTRPRTTLIAVTVLTSGSFLAAQGPAPLPLDKLTSDTLGQDASSEYPFKAEAPGLLTVLLLGTEGDLTLELLDEDGQRVPNGFADSDIEGNAAREQLHVVLPETGLYLLRVDGRGQANLRYEIGAAWLQAPALAAAPDPDGRPSRARELRVGEPIEDQVDASQGDHRDWYVITPAASGTLTVVTRGEEGDLMLEAFTNGNFSQPVARSDQDLDGKGANESIVVDVKAGQPVHLRVSPVFSGGGAYRISAGLMP